MSDINLAFTPNADFQESRFTGSAGGIITTPLSVIVPKAMFHRRVYLGIAISSGTYSFTGSLNFYMAGSIVCSFKNVQTNGANNNQTYFGNMSGITPLTVDMLRVSLNATTLTLAPFHAIVACDKIQLDGVSTNSAAGVIIAYLGVFSQNYW